MRCTFGQKHLLRLARCSEPVIILTPQTCTFGATMLLQSSRALRDRIIAWDYGESSDGLRVWLSAVTLGTAGIGYARCAVASGGGMMRAPVSQFHC
jgi:hypothetical protein